MPALARQLAARDGTLYAVGPQGVHAWTAGTWVPLDESDPAPGWLLPTGSDSFVVRTSLGELVQGRFGVVALAPAPM